ncbi:hypothetical protein [Providencia phage PSTCR5]|uniref:Uncharacterized protein n=1 Tax=Providencia phage PSTCR5 TaxID=2783547 RepID=A0A873WTI2_9CAUD|nr:hypothetical protein KNV68_gp144 [Providencia phage PSTCR5]QPB12214.1 hypothetical protein [Providencia phage PSTCR5]
MNNIDFDKIKRDKDLLLKRFMDAKEKAEQNNEVRSIKLD